MLRSNSKSLGNPCSQCWRRKGKAGVGRICRQGRFKFGMKDRVADGKLIISMTVSGIGLNVSLCMCSFRSGSSLVCSRPDNTSAACVDDSSVPNVLVSFIWNAFCVFQKKMHLNTKAFVFWATVLKFCRPNVFIFIRGENFLNTFFVSNIGAYVTSMKT